DVSSVTLVSESVTTRRLVGCVLIFFFSSRRRHTRSKRDWSSDVCSSDLFLSDQNWLESLDLSGFAARWWIFFLCIQQENQPELVTHTTSLLNNPKPLPLL